MRFPTFGSPLRVLGLLGAMLLLAPSLTRCESGDESSRLRAGQGDADEHQAVADTTWMDHDRQPISRPQDWQPNYWRGRVHQGLVEPISHVFDIPDKLLWLARALGVTTRREAVNANAFDEVANSSWFTNRNHSRAVPVEKLREGPDSAYIPAMPWTIKHGKRSGWSPGFQIKDADGKKWLVKLDTRDYPQLSSGADMVARTLLHAAGYNVPHNAPVRFRRGDLTIDSDLQNGAKGERFTDEDLDSVLAYGAVFPDSSYSASASLFLSGSVLGSPSMSRLRPDDSNDWYAHANRRELRGLFVLCSWLNDWDTEDHQFLDTFVATHDSLGHVDHYVLDVGSTFGAAASGPKQLWAGYEHLLDLQWTMRRFVTLGFVEEPSWGTRQETGIPAIGHYESLVYKPQDFRTLVEQPAFREMTDRDGYWGAKIVASFSNAQIAAAVDAARFEDPRASDYMVQNLIVRRDKIARYWFGRVAPLDFFSVDDAALRFHDLAVDVGLVAPRAYEIDVESKGGRGPRKDHVHLATTEWPLPALESGASHLSLQISVAGDRAQSTRVELTRKDSVWVVTRVRHG